MDQTLSKIGNVFESSLKEISDYGFSIKYFNEHRSLCLAGEDKDFAGKFLSKKGQTIFKPALPENIFSEEEYVYTSEFATKQRKVIAIGQAN